MFCKQCTNDHLAVENCEWELVCPDCGSVNTKAQSRQLARCLTCNGLFLLTSEPQRASVHETHWSGRTGPYGVTEYHGNGDPFFGGSADDRQLYENGRYMRGCDAYGLKPARFETLEQAVSAALKAARRPDSLLSVSVCPE